MRISASMLGQLQQLGGSPGDTAILGALRQLVVDVSGAVPSCVAVSVLLTSFGGTLTVSTLAAGAASTPVLASLRLPLPGPNPAGVLVLQASEPGAFLLLADDLTSQLGGSAGPVVLDDQLAAPPQSTDATGVTLTDLSAVNQALGVLLERGLEPERARQELTRRATTAAISLPAVARGLLAALPLVDGTPHPRETPEQPVG